MGYYAQLNVNNIVQQVVVADPDVVQTLLDGIWAETFKNDPLKRFAGVGDGFDGSDFIAKPFHTSNWNPENREWVTPPEIGIVNNISPIIAADGVDFVTVYIVGADANSTQEIMVNNEPFSVDTNASGYGEFELSSDTPGLLLVAWGQLNVKVAAL